MRKILAAAFLTLDGVMQAPGGPEEDRDGGFAFGGWLAARWEDEIGAAMDETFRGGFDLLLGRRTYDIFAAHWPFVPSDPSDPGYEPGMAEIGRVFGRVTKYVATHHPESLAWENTEWLGRDPVAKLREIKTGDGPPLLTQGSSALIQTLLAADLIDELRLIVAPVVLGSGKRLFGDGTQPRTLGLVTSRTTPRGTIIATYQRSGAVEVASFALEPPTTAEVERRNQATTDGPG